MPMRGQSPVATCDAVTKEQTDMHLPRWLVHLTMVATLISGSALCAGWKWELVPLFPH